MAVDLRCIGQSRISDKKKPHREPAGQLWRRGFRPQAPAVFNEGQVISDRICWRSTSMGTIFPSRLKHQ